MADNSKRKKQDPEQQRQRKEEQARASRRRSRQFIGLALSILVVVGAVSIVMGGINLVRNMMDNTGEWDEYKTRFEPMVWFDILPFDSVTTVDENAIKQICIWGYMNTTPEEERTRDEFGQLLVPALEVDQYAVRLFGPNFRFSVHESFTDREWDLQYHYDEATQRYTMPATGLDARYLATVVDVERVSWGERRVVMGYVSTRTGDNQVVQQPDYEHPVKYMDYMLRRDGSSYYLYAVQNNTTHVPTATEQAQSIPSMLPAESVPDYVPPETSAASSAGASDIPVSSGPDAAGGEETDPGVSSEPDVSSGQNDTGG